MKVNLMISASDTDDLMVKEFDLPFTPFPGLALSVGAHPLAVGDKLVLALDAVQYDPETCSFDCFVDEEAYVNSILTFGALAKMGFQPDSR